MVNCVMMMQALAMPRETSSLVPPRVEQEVGGQLLVAVAGQEGLQRLLGVEAELRQPLHGVALRGGELDLDAALLGAALGVG